MRGILLINLGSPEAPTVPAVRRYLHEFLMDPYVMDVPWILRAFLVYTQIVPQRVKQSTHAYQSIWMDEGSPLIVTTKKLRCLLKEHLSLPVEMAMRYGTPSIEVGFTSLITQLPKGSDITVVPLYPHYAYSSFETGVEEVNRVAKKLGVRSKLHFLSPFYNHTRYIDALTESARPHLTQPYDHLLVSFHGLPVHHLQKWNETRNHCLASPDCCDRPSPAHAKCYRHQTLATARLFAERADIPFKKYSISFQSRLGKDPWLLPATDQELVRLAREGVKQLVVICPSFVADCLETLEEIGIRGRNAFLEAGGEELRLIPCLNDHPRWAEALAALCVA